MKENINIAKVKVLLEIEVTGKKLETYRKCFRKFEHIEKENKSFFLKNDLRVNVNYVRQLKESSHCILKKITKK